MHGLFKQIKTNLTNNMYSKNILLLILLTSSTIIRAQNVAPSMNDALAAPEAPANIALPAATLNNTSSANAAANLTSASTQPSENPAATGGGNAQPSLQEKTTIDYRSAPFVDVIRQLADATKINISISPELERDKTSTVTLRLTDITYETALSTVLKLFNCGTVLENGILRIDKMSSILVENQRQEVIKKDLQTAEPARTLIWQLNYASADSIANIVRSNLQQSYGHLGGKFQLSADARSNKLMIYSIQEVQSKAKAIIENLDKPEQQIAIEARIVEASNDVRKTLDIKWESTFGGAFNGLNTGLLFPNSILGSMGGPSLPGGAVGSMTPDTGALGLSFGSLNGILNLNTIFKAFESEEQLNIVAAPTMTVINNGKAHFKEDFELSIFRVIGGVPQEFKKTSTISMDVTPKIGSDNLISLDVSVKRDLEPQTSTQGTDGVTTVTKREAQTIMTVRSGETAVIGGLYQTRREKTVQRLPILSKIPVIGFLFRNELDYAGRSEVMILITPRIINPGGYAKTSAPVAMDMSGLPANTTSMTLPPSTNMSTNMGTLPANSATQSSNLDIPANTAATNMQLNNGGGANLATTAGTQPAAANAGLNQAPATNAGLNQAPAANAGLNQAPATNAGLNQAPAANAGLNQAPAANAGLNQAPATNADVAAPETTGTNDLGGL